MAKYLEQLTADMKTAMKAGEKDKLGVIRMVIANLKDEPMRLNKADLSEEEELGVLRRAVKTRRDSVDQANQVGRTEIAEREQAEIEVIQKYLPQQLTGDALLAKVKEVAEAAGYGGPKDTGKFMKAWMSQHKDLAEGRDVQAALKQLA